MGALFSSVVLTSVLRGLAVLVGYGVYREETLLGPVGVEARAEGRFLGPEGFSGGGMSDLRVGGAMAELEDLGVTGSGTALTWVVFVCCTVCVASGILEGTGIGTGWRRGCFWSFLTPCLCAAGWVLGFAGMGAFVPLEDLLDGRRLFCVCRCRIISAKCFCANSHSDGVG